jgi:hypothetical protein
MERITIDKKSSRVTVYEGVNGESNATEAYIIKQMCT